MEENKIIRELIMSFSSEKICCFTGNRPQKLPWGNNEQSNECRTVKAKMREEIIKLYEIGYQLFVCGMALGADMYFAEEVLKLRGEGFKIFLECAVPFSGQDRNFSTQEKQRYKIILEQADLITVVSQTYTPWCMHKRNAYMVDKSSAIISLSYQQNGGSASTLERAKSKKLKIIELNQ